ncbi:hypothetical protein JW964_19810, partial [candidate division KSB1 bacterium]|nr:hypothetical protein [candidate division KSB1 bacterium]
NLLEMIYYDPGWRFGKARLVLCQTSPNNRSEYDNKIQIENQRVVRETGLVKLDFKAIWIVKLYQTLHLSMSGDLIFLNLLEMINYDL